MKIFIKLNKKSSQELEKISYHNLIKLEIENNDWALDIGQTGNGERERGKGKKGKIKFIPFPFNL
ncbi:MAG: hypothetical protein RM338_23375 [Nostoc sp. DedQUE12a]|nr:hypothetical protein [Nostoc sp. DedQUE12a]